MLLVDLGQQPLADVWLPHAAGFWSSLMTPLELVSVMPVICDRSVFQKNWLKILCSLR